MATHVSAVAGCYLPWHWARWDRELLLCVRVLVSGSDARPLTAWSGGFRIDTARSLHIACRYTQRQPVRTTRHLCYLRSAYFNSPKVALFN